MIEDELRLAVKRLKNGSTVGLVRQHIQQQGLGLGAQESLVTAAKKTVNRHHRFKHIIVMISGSMLAIIGAIYLFAGLPAGR